MRRLTAAQVKKLPHGQNVRFANNETGRHFSYYVFRNGKDVFLHNPLSGFCRDIVPREGWHYELPEADHV